MDRVSIVEVLEQIEAENVLPHSRNVQCSCTLAKWEHPRGRDSRPSMGISIDPKGPSLVHCFACGYRGTIEMMIQRIQRHKPEVDMTLLVQRVSDLETVAIDTVVERLDEYEDTTRTMEEETLPGVYLERFKGLAHPYILKRGFKIDPTLRQWEVGYDNEEKRVVFPVRNRVGELVGAVGRGVGRNPRPKYKNYWEFEKGLYLFGEHLLPQDPCRVVVVEGPLDALRVWQEHAVLGLHVNVVALMGAKATRKQIEKLARASDELLLFLDNDSAGWEGQRLLVDALGREMLVTAVRYPEPVEGDPDTLGAAVVELCKEPDLFV